MHGWRVWLVRGLVFSVLGVIAAGVYLFLVYTDSERVRQMVQDKLGVKFERVSVQLASAQFRLLGGVFVQELRLARCDGLDRGDFLYVPSAVLFHDKEHLLDGKVLVRRVEMEGPQLRLVRHRDGRFNLTGLTTPGDPAERLPTVVVRGGTLVFEDQQLAPGVNLIEIKGVHLTALNDPLPTVRIEATGKSDALGPVTVRATFDRRTQAVDADVRLDDVPVPALVGRIAAVAPDARPLARLTGRGTAKATVRYDGRALRYRAEAAIEGGSFHHPPMHAALENIELSATIRDGEIPEAKLKARLDGATVTANLCDFKVPRSRQEVEALPTLVRSFDAEVTHLPVTAKVLQALPPPLAFIANDFAPAGPISLTYAFNRDTGGTPSQVWVARPQGMSACYHGFKYAMSGITGSVRVDTSRLPTNDVSLNLTGLTPRGKVVTVKGTYKGDKGAPELVLDVAGRDVALDGRLAAALPRTAQDLAEQFLPAECREVGGLDRHPMGLADFRAQIVRKPGSPTYDKTIQVRFHGVRARYDQFPYPLEDVTGLLVIHPDHWEALGFHGRHDGGVIGVEGRSFKLPDRPVAALLDGGGGRRERVKLEITGKSIRLGSEFEAALVPDGATAKGGAAERKAMQKAWKSLALTGRFDFNAVLIDDPDHPPDVDFRITLNKCRMKPAFFAYELGDVTGLVTYKHGNIYLDNFTAQHQSSPVSLRWGLVQPKGEHGRLMAWLDGIRATGLKVDDDLLTAMPESLARTVRTLKLGPALDLGIDVRLEGTAPGSPPKVWWDGGVTLAGCSLRTGVELDKVTGQFFTKGHHDGHALCWLTGQLVLQEARAFGQPAGAVTAWMEVPVRTPDVLQVRNIKGTIFGGTLGGEANVRFGPRPAYDVMLDVVGVDLAAVGKHNLRVPGQHLEGRVRTVVHLHGEGDDLTGLRGNGRIDIAHGKMGELPVILDLLKTLGLRKPDGIAFEQAHAVFTLAGPRAHVSLMDLYGSAVSLRGSGGLNLDGSDVALDFAATFGRIDEWMPFGLDRLPRMLSSQLLKLKMRGGMGPNQKMTFDKEFVPGVLDPIRRAVGR